MADARGPLISVIIPVYNGVEGLKRAIESILAQTHQNFELIVVDDCSTEPIEAAVLSFHDPRLTYLRRPENKGASAARNTGMKKAKGDLVAFLDSDDHSLPERLEAEAAVLKAHPDVALVTSNLRSSDDSNNTYVPAKIVSGLVTATAFPGSVFSPPSSWMLRRSAVESAGYFDEAIRSAEDADYFVRILECSGVYYLNQVLGVKYFSTERKGYFLPEHFSGNDLFLSRHLPRMQRDPDYLSRFYYLRGKDYSRAGRPKVARENLWQAFLVKPTMNYFFKYLKSLFIQ